jgi:hypothetical protein
MEKLKNVPNHQPDQFNVGKTTINHPFGNGKHTSYKNGDLRDGLLLLYPH